MKYWLISVLFVCAACPTATPVEEEDAAENQVGTCSMDSDCGIWGQCVQGVCATDLCAGGACEDNECTDRNDCQAGMVCINSECVNPPESCTSSEDCPAGTVCDAWTGECIDPNAPTDVGGDGGNSDGTLDGSLDGTGSDIDAGAGDGTGTGSGDGSSNGSSDGSANVVATETCLGAPTITGTSGSLQGNYGLLNDYVTNHTLTQNWYDGCTETSVSSGREVVVAIELGSSDTLTVTVDAECATCDQSEKKIDEIIYLLNTCPADGTSFDGSLDNCVAGAQDNNGGPDDPTETFTYTNTGDAQTFYIVVDAWCADLDWFHCPTSADGFTLEWSIQ